MQKLGIIGGIGPEATMNYYSAIIKRYQERIGTDKELPRITIESINMYHMFRLLDAQQYDKVAGYVGAASGSSPNYLELFEFFFAGLELPAPRTMDFLPPKFYFVVTDERLENSLAGIADNSWQYQSTDLYILGEGSFSSHKRPLKWLTEYQALISIAVDANFEQILYAVGDHQTCLFRDNKNPWFEEQVIPDLQRRIQIILNN